MKTFVNFSNHPSASWSAEQREAAEQYGKIIDITFPQVDAAADEAYVNHLAERMIEEIISCNPAAVMVQGEFTLVFRVVTELLERGVRTVAACSERKTEEWTQEDGTIVKKAVFQFVRFREYRGR